MSLSLVILLFKLLPISTKYVEKSLQVIEEYKSAGNFVVIMRTLKIKKVKEDHALLAINF